MSIDVEYAVKKDIRNNPVARGVDDRQRRDFRRIVCLVMLIVATVVFSAWQHYQTVRFGYLIEEMRQKMAVEEVAKRQLRVEREFLSAPQSLQQRAAEQLHMVAPSVDDTVVIERAPAVTAGKGIVAEVR
jgi:cell division protein FtsL